MCVCECVCSYDDGKIDGAVNAAEVQPTVAVSGRFGWTVSFALKEATLV